MTDNGSVIKLLNRQVAAPCNKMRSEVCRAGTNYWHIDSWHMWTIIYAVLLDRKDCYVSGATCQRWLSFLFSPFLSIPVSFEAVVRSVSLWVTHGMKVGLKKLQSLCSPVVKPFDHLSVCLHMVPASDRRTDGQTDGRRQLYLSRAVA